MSKSVNSNQKYCENTAQFFGTRLRTSYGLDGTVIAWFSSYLSGRTQHVRLTSTTSTPSAIVCGVPQGSVLGPILFLLYVADLLSLV